MNVPDSLFILALNNYTRVFDDGKTLRLEWSPSGLKVCRNTCKATLVLKDVEPIRLPEGSVIEWNQFVRGKRYSLLQDGQKNCELRVFDHDSKAWLDSTADGTTPDIMRQTALALEEVYGKSISVEELNRCLEIAKTALPTGVDDELKQRIIDRWVLRQKRVAAEMFTNQQSTVEELSISYWMFKHNITIVH